MSQEQERAIHVTAGTTDSREAHTVTLPSKGAWYKKYGYDKETIEVYELTTREEKILSQNRAKPFDTFYQLVKRLIPASTWIAPTDENQHGFSYDDLLLSDQFYLFMMIRAISVSEEYSFKVGCPSCGGSFSKTIHIPHDLEVRTAEDVEDAGSDWEVEIPFGGGEATLTCRCLRLGDEKVVQKKHHNSLRRSGVNDASEAELRMARIILGVDGGTFKTQQDVLNFYHSLSFRASSYIRDELVARDTGVSTDMTFECPGCGEEFESTLPFTRDFFHPERKAAPKHY